MTQEKERRYALVVLDSAKCSTVEKHGCTVCYSDIECLGYNSFSTESELVERMARGIWSVKKRAEEIQFGSGRTFEGLSEAGKNNLRELARAALKAMEGGGMRDEKITYCEKFYIPKISFYDYSGLAGFKKMIRILWLGFEITFATKEVRRSKK